VPVLTLRKMTPGEFAAFREKEIRGYAAEQIRAGNWSPEQAESLATQETDRRLPQGADTPEMLLLLAEDQGEGVVGSVWVALEEEGLDGAWIYSIEISPAYRGRGYGRALLSAVEDELRRLDVGRVGLNVFGTNSVARRLYESSGYEISSVYMHKRLTG
jgi:ribosomal protein S18 acetylase RimI-like enzyme